MNLDNLLDWIQVAILPLTRGGSIGCGLESLCESSKLPRFFGARLKAGICLIPECPPEGGRYTKQNQVRTLTLEVSFRVMKVFCVLVACILFAGMSLFAQSEQVFKGKVCLGPEGRTPTVENGEVSLPCTVAHPKLGAKFILFDAENKTAHRLDGHPKPKGFAGMRVVVVGTLDTATDTIHIDDMFHALPPKVTRASSVYIDCDACPRGMAAAWQAAFDELEDWGRFDITPDPKKADLIFIFSANPYLGDYVTRDGPDKRPVAVKITYMDIVDPETGKDLWSDNRSWGSLFVARATRDLIKQLKLRMEEETLSDPQAILEKEHRERKSSPNLNN
jgi:hypothetical protein